MILPRTADRDDDSRNEVAMTFEQAQVMNSVLSAVTSAKKSGLAESEIIEAIKKDVHYGSSAHSAGGLSKPEK
jgi:hypothetical protein